MKINVIIQDKNMVPLATPEVVEVKKKRNTKYYTNTSQVEFQSFPYYGTAVYITVWNENGVVSGKLNSELHLGPFIFPCFAKDALKLDLESIEKLEEGM